MSTDPENTAAVVPGACDGHLVPPPEADVYCFDDPKPQPQQPCPDGGMHSGDNIHYPAVCVHDDDYMHRIPRATDQSGATA